MGGEARQPRECVLPVALALYRTLETVCEVNVDTLKRKIMIVGSLRREKETVGDIEIVAVPKLLWSPDVFGELAWETESSQLESWIRDQIEGGTLQWDTKVKRNGKSYKRFIVPELDGMPFELFLCDEEEFGYQCMIRTGDATFTRMMMTERPGGLKPLHIDCKGGAKVVRGGKMVPLELHNERELFDAWGLPVLHPRERDEVGATKLKGMMKR